MILLLPQAEISAINNNIFPCTHSSIVSGIDEDDYLTQQGIQNKALKAMIDRVLESKDTQNYDYQSSIANINDYGFFEKQIELNY